MTVGDTSHQAALRDKAIQTWEEIYEGDEISPAFFAAIMPLLTPDACIVDIGCGTGHILRDLFDRAVVPPHRLIGVDPSPAMLAIARERTPDGVGIDWLAGEAACLPLATGSVDVAISRLSEYEPAELARVLASGGHFIEYGLGPLDSAELANVFGTRFLCDYVPTDGNAWLAARSQALSAVGLETIHFEVFEGRDYLTRAQLIDTIEMVPLVDGFSASDDAALLDRIPVEARPDWDAPRHVVRRQFTLREAIRR
jgi:SAM-dependent methyltransferase